MSSQPTVIAPNGLTERNGNNGASKIAMLAPEGRGGRVREQSLLDQLNDTTFRDFVEAATVGIHCVSGDGTILWVNRAELDLLGYSLEEYIGCNISQFHVDRPVIDDILRRLSSGELAWLG